MADEFRLAPAIGARFVGAAFVTLAVLVFVATFVAAAGAIAFVWVLVAGVVGVGVIIAVGTALRRVPAVRFDDQGYRVRWIRGVGVRAASWRSVEDASTATAEQSGRPIDCVVIRLADQATTTIPVDALAEHRDQLVSLLRDRLKQARPSRPLSAEPSPVDPADSRTDTPPRP